MVLAHQVSHTGSHPILFCLLTGLSVLPDRVDSWLIPLRSWLRLLFSLRKAGLALVISNTPTLSNGDDWTLNTLLRLRESWALEEELVVVIVLVVDARSLGVFCTAPAPLGALWMNERRHHFSLTNRPRP